MLLIQNVNNSVTDVMQLKDLLKFLLFRFGRFRFRDGSFGFFGVFVDVVFLSFSRLLFLLFFFFGFLWFGLLFFAAAFEELRKSVQVAFSVVVDDFSIGLEVFDSREGSD